MKIVDEACILLAEYNGRLAAELEDRTMVSKMLQEFIAEQKFKIVEGDKKLEVRVRKTVLMDLRDSLRYI